MSSLFFEGDFIGVPRIVGDQCQVERDFVPESAGQNPDMRALAGGNWVCYVRVNFRVEPRVGGGQSLSTVCASELRVLSCVASMDSPIGEDGIIGKLIGLLRSGKRGAGMNGCFWGDRWGD